MLNIFYHRLVQFRNTSSACCLSILEAARATSYEKVGVFLLSSVHRVVTLHLLHILNMPSHRLDSWVEQEALEILYPTPETPITAERMLLSRQSGWHGDHVVHERFCGPPFRSVQCSPYQFSGHLQVPFPTQVAWSSSICSRSFVTVTCWGVIVIPLGLVGSNPTHSWRSQIVSGSPRQLGNPRIFEAWKGRRHTHVYLVVPKRGIHRLPSSTLQASFPAILAPSGISLQGFFFWKQLVDALYSE